MKKILILICVNFLMCQFIFSQKIEAKIYFKSGAVKSGLLDISNIKSNYLYLKNDQGKYDNILPDLILRIEMADSLNIFTEEVNNEDQKKFIFIRAIVNAPISLYAGNLDEENEIYYIQDSLFKLARIKLIKSGFWIQLQTLYPECNLQKKYGYNQYTLAKLIIKINECKNGKLAVINKNIKTTDWNVDIGCSISHYSQVPFEDGWYGPAYLPTKYFKSITSTPMNLFTRISMADRIIFKIGIQYFKINFHNDSLHKLIANKDKTWKEVRAEIDFDIEKYRLPITVGYNFRCSNKSSIIFEVGTNIVIKNNFIGHSDFPQPYTSTHNNISDNLKNLNLQAYFSYKYKISKFYFEPFIKFENGFEEINTFTPNYIINKNQTTINYEKGEYGFALSYRLK